MIARMEEIKKKLNFKNLPQQKPISPVLQPSAKKDTSHMEYLLSRKHIKFNLLKDNKDEQEFDEEAARTFNLIK